ncbi:MAG: HAD family hydrolase [Victivallaceae bacterium]|nr:HAD family hydrolase [Victivallaceae bacterium]
MKSIKRLFDRQEKLLPVPTRKTLNFARDDSIKCVIFDIYGTLLISRSGDIDKLELSPDCVLESFSRCGIRIISTRPDKVARDIIESYKRTIRDLRESARENNIGTPEIDIREVWDILLHKLYNEKLIDRPWKDEVKTLAVYFETLSNPVYPMPFMKEIILYLRKREIPLGIISNAQFYTPVIMNYFLRGEVGNAEDIEHFDRDLSIFSYREKLGKPDVRLFEKVLSACSYKYGFESSEILFVGNDMLKDIYPAWKQGMRTALFVGDCRSLRLRYEIPELQNTQPDYTIDSLEQITEIVS